MIDNYVITEKIQQSVFNSNELVTIPYILMIIANLTTTERGQKQLFCSDKKELENVQGLIYLRMLEKYFENI